MFTFQRFMFDLLIASILTFKNRFQVYKSH